MANPGRTPRIEIRVTDLEYTVEEVAATAFGISLSESYQRAARGSAEEVITERSSVILNQAEAERFLDALEHAERFEPGMARLAFRSPVIPTS